MWRTAGVDFDNYVEYHSNPELIPDLGYRVMAQFFTSIGIGFTAFLVIQSLFTVYSIYRFSGYSAAPFLVSLGIFVVHSAIVRDLSQSRVGLAVTFIFLAYAQRSCLKKIILMLVACSVHLTVIPSVLMFWFVEYAASWKKSRLIAFLIASGVVALLLGSYILPLLRAVDPRIELYLQWDEAMYGAPVDDYSQLLFYLLLWGVATYAYSVTRQTLFLRFSILAYFAILLFVAFRDVAIFAYRMSHLLTVFYPFVFSKILAYRFSPARALQDIKVHFSPFAIKLLTVSISVAVLLISLRPSNADVLSQVVSIFNF